MHAGPSEDLLMPEEACQILPPLPNDVPGFAPHTLQCPSTLFSFTLSSLPRILFPHLLCPPFLFQSREWEEKRLAHCQKRAVAFGTPPQMPGGLGPARLGVLPCPSTPHISSSGNPCLCQARDERGVWLHEQVGEALLTGEAAALHTVGGPVFNLEPLTYQRAGLGKALGSRRPGTSPFQQPPFGTGLAAAFTAKNPPREETRHTAGVWKAL